MLPSTCCIDFNVLLISNSSSYYVSNTIVKDMNTEQWVESADEEEQPLTVICTGGTRTVYPLLTLDSITLDLQRRTRTV